MMITIFISGSSTIQPPNCIVWCLNAIIINKEQALVIQRLDGVIYPTDQSLSSG